MKCRNKNFLKVKGDRKVVASRFLSGHGLGELHSCSVQKSASQKSFRSLSDEIPVMRNVVINLCGVYAP